MRTSEVLSAARAHLWDGEGVLIPESQSKYICYAISRVQAKSRAKDDAVDLVLAQLDTYGSFEGYLIGRGVPDRLADDPEWMQLRRRELLTRLISQCEREGN